MALSYASNVSSSDEEDLEYILDMTIEELLNVKITTGTRKKNKDLLDSTVPVDSFGVDLLEFHGSGDMSTILKELMPSYNTMVRAGDGAAFVHSTSLRGLPPDNVLLLINSKRRHRSALIQHGGPAATQGSQAADPGPLPVIAFKNIELLRDAAASQYGSDAIAGVINFILKDSSEGSHVDLQWGNFYQGERALKLAINKGLPFGNKGFINLSAEYIDDDQLVRGTQPLAAITAIEAGIPNVGQDSPYSGDSQAQTWGRPENHGLRTAWNIGYAFNDKQQFYAFGNYADYYGNFRFFYRTPDHFSLQPMPIVPDDPSQGNFCWCDSLPAGYTPYLEADITDIGSTFGLRGEYDNATFYDFSGYFGSNKMVYLYDNTLNSSFGPNSPRDFELGDLIQKEVNFNADFSRKISENTNFAYGFEWRKETYILEEGQLESWALGPWGEVGLLVNPVTGENYAAPLSGSNGLPGTSVDVPLSYVSTLKH